MVAGWRRQLLRARDVLAVLEQPFDRLRDAFTRPDVGIKFGLCFGDRLVDNLRHALADLVPVDDPHPLAAVTFGEVIERDLWALASKAESSASEYRVGCSPGRSGVERSAWGRG
jgi:hypothetical protein